jgi:hypothetical protein
MARTKRAQVLMEPEEFRRLRVLARQRKTSIGQLIRRALNMVYFDVDQIEERKAIVARIASMNLPVVEWHEAKKEIEALHDEADLP